jgi:hypothetical protein
MFASITLSPVRLILESPFDDCLIFGNCFWNKYSLDSLELLNESYRFVVSVADDICDVDVIDGLFELIELRSWVLRLRWFSSFIWHCSNHHSSKSRWSFKLNLSITCWICSISLFFVLSCSKFLWYFSLSTSIFFLIFSSSSKSLLSFESVAAILSCTCSSLFFSRSWY